MAWAAAKEDSDQFRFGRRLLDELREPGAMAAAFLSESAGSIAIGRIELTSCKLREEAVSVRALFLFHPRIYVVAVEYRSVWQKELWPTGKLAARPLNVPAKGLPAAV